MNVYSYLEKVNQHYKSGHATEHTYRGDFAELISALVPNIHVTNEPSNVTDCGNPDYVIFRNRIPVGFIEAKDVGKDLNGKLYKEQFSRYRKALDNLIITDYISFQFFQNGQLIHEISIAEIDGKNIKPLPNNFDRFGNLMQDFCSFIAQTIKSPKTLAKMMAAKARLLENILENALTSDEENERNSAIKQQYEIFRNILIHDLSPKGFADIYAQTLAYGMFGARLHDKTLDTFSRQEAAALIPKSNPFLRRLFDHLAGIDIDDRIVTTVDNLADVFRATNVEALLKNFGKSTQTQDPIIHFYETFLAEYDPKLRKARGVWYTPEPVVKFIVRGVDKILKAEFGLNDGLADTSKTTIKIKTDKPDRRTKSGYVEIDREVHRIQVLDPAAGTGTFLAEVVRYIYSSRFKAMQGAWSSYVEEHLIPRINGFELLMASYAVAHLKLDMLLTETGYRSQKNTRFNIFLTNSLEEYHPDTGTLFSSWLSTEANEANHVKRDTPVMVVMGNPPYSGESANKSPWIMGLMEDYKKEPGGKEKLKERNSKWINDDYVKFMRYGQHFIEKRGEGVLAYITPHGFLSNPTFRGVRWNILRTYDKIYTIDLHGNSKKKEISPDGSADINVFDIQQGVSINFFIKTGKKREGDLAQVFHHDLYGAREYKYQYLLDMDIDQIPFKELPTVGPMYFIVQKNFDLLNDYMDFMSLYDLFKEKSAGIVTARDSLCIHFDFNDVKKTVGEFNAMDIEAARAKFGLGKDANDWKVSLAKQDISSSGPKDSNITKITYRPFDIRYTYYTGTSKGFHCRPRQEVMDHLVHSDNVAIICPKQMSASEKLGIFITKNIAGHKTCSAYNINTVFPLYLIYMQENEKGKISNISKPGIAFFEASLGVKFDEESEVLNSENIFYYVFGILNSAKYLSAFADFLDFDFPRIPPPKSKEVFLKFRDLGRSLREVQLLEAASINNFISAYPIDGNNQISRAEWDLYDKERKLGRLWINHHQYFDSIPLKAWEFCVGGYQPAEKWISDRIGRALSFEDILNYQKIIMALLESDRVMQEIDNVDFN